MISGPLINQAPPITERSKGAAWHHQSAEDVLTQLGTTANGLSAQDAAQRLAADGPNELREGKHISSPLVLELMKVVGHTRRQNTTLIKRMKT